LGSVGEDQKNKERSVMVRKANTIMVYKTAIFTSLILMTLLWVLPYVDHFWLTEKELSFLGWSGYGAKMEVSAVAYWCFYGVILLNMIGLYFLRNMARMFFVLFVVSSIFLPALWGFTVTTPLEAAVSFSIAVLYGVLLTLSFMKPLAEQFK
jgi:hypothetical protein